MSNGIYDILGKLNRSQPKDNPVSMSAEPIYESIDPQDITPAVDSLEEKYQNFLIEETAKRSQQKDAEISRGEPEIVKLLNKARLERPAAASDTEALAYQMVKANKELEKANAANDEQEKKIADLDAKIGNKPAPVAPAPVAPPAAKVPQAQPVPVTPAQKSAAVINFPTTATQPVPQPVSQAEPEYQLTPKGAQQADQLGKPAPQAQPQPAVTKPVRTYKSAGERKPAVGGKVAPSDIAIPDEVAQARAAKAARISAVNVGGFAPIAPIGKVVGQNENKLMKDMLKESIEMLREYKEGSPELGIYNYNDMLKKFQSGQQRVTLNFGTGKPPLTLYDYQAYGLLAVLGSDQNQERKVQNIETTMANHDAVVQMLMTPQVKKYISLFPEFASKSPVFKARASEVEKGKFKLSAPDPKKGFQDKNYNPKTDPNSPEYDPTFPQQPHPYQQGDTQLEENSGNDTMQENVKTSSILQAVHQVEDKKLRESAKPDFLDLDKDGDTDEPMKSAAKTAKDHEPAEVDSDAVAKRKRLQALKDKQEDERAEKGDDYKSASRFVKGRAYGGSAQKDDEDKDEVDEVAPPGAKAERMVKHIKKGYAKDGKLSKREKGIAYATAWKAHNKGQVEEATNFGDTIKNSEGKMTKVKVTEGKDAIRNHPIYTTKEAWDHYAQELAEQETMETSMMEAPVVDVQQELAEIASLAGLTYESKCSSCGCADCKCGTLDESMSRKDYRSMADEISQMENRDDAKRLAHKYAVIAKKDNSRFKEDMFFAACGLDIAECGMTAPATIVVGEDKCPACDCAPCKCDEGMIEAEMDEGNEFTKARLDAIAQGSDTFTVGGKTHNVTGDTSDEKQQVEESKVVTEDINVSINANGEQDALNLLRKLSGMAEVPHVTGVAIPMEEEQATCEACGMIPCGCEESVEEERDIELANTPHEEVAPISAVTTDAGGGLGGVKKQYPAAANRGANPLEEQVEESLWSAYESMINDVKA